MKTTETDNYKVKFKTEKYLFGSEWNKINNYTPLTEVCELYIKLKPITFFFFCKKKQKRFLKIYFYSQNIKFNDENNTLKTDSYVNRKDHQNGEPDFYKQKAKNTDRTEYLISYRAH